MTTGFVGRRRWGDWTSEAFAALDRTRLTAVLPIGAIEQHGPHLPMVVDTATVEALVDAVIPRLPADLPVLFLPTLPVGKSNEHCAYPGTLTLSAGTLLALWGDIGACVARAGVRRLLFFNSHGGQDGLAQVAARDLREKHGMLVGCVNWYELGLPEGLFPATELADGIHAGDLETSVMLHIQPESVAMDRAADFIPRERELRRRHPELSFLHGPATLAWLTQDLNREGACGNARAATAAKGRAVVEHVAERFAQVLVDFDTLPTDWVLDGPTG